MVFGDNPPEAAAAAAGVGPRPPLHSSGTLFTVSKASLTPPAAAVD